MTPEPWLLLLHQLPAHPVSVRVKTWRRLQKLGAVAVKNSVYALPNRPETREDFEWVRAEIVAAGGQATVFQASTIDSLSSEDLRETFRREREKDYRALTRAVAKLARGARSAGRDPRALAKLSRAWRERLHAIEALDYFGAGGRDEARAEVSRVERLAPAAQAADRAMAASGTLDAAAFQQRRWVTRQRPGIDRMGSAWLIRRFIDPGAEFAFAPPDGRREAGTLTFDMFEGDFTHEGDRCTFEVLCVRFALVDAGLGRIAEIVHDLDLKDNRFGRSEAALGTVIEGLQHLYASDDELLEHGIALFEALYQGRAAPSPSPVESVKPSSRARRPRREVRENKSGRTRTRTEGVP
jgi:hypothetical protein